MIASEPAEGPVPGASRLFVLTTFVVATLVGVVIAYLGVRGYLGVAIP